MMDDQDDDENLQAMRKKQGTEAGVSNFEGNNNNLSMETEKVYKSIKLSKRTREESEGDLEGYTTIGKGGKRIRRLTSNKSEKCDDDNEYTEVTVTSQEVLPKQIGFAKILKNENITHVMRVIYKNPYKIIMRFKDDISAENFLKCENIQKKSWNCRKTGEINFSYGLVKEIDLELEEKNIKEIIESETEIIQVKRLFRKDKDGKWIKSETVRLCFKGPILPPYVYAYGSRMKVEPFTFPVTQCSNCWKYGHVKNFCPMKKPICPKCGSEHENCDTQSFKCVNCKGSHMSMVKSKCPAFLREKMVRDVMASSNCTYKEALKIIQEEKRQSETDTNTKQEDIHKTILSWPKLGDGLDKETWAAKASTSGFAHKVKQTDNILLSSTSDEKEKLQRKKIRNRKTKNKKENKGRTEEELQLSSSSDEENLSPRQEPKKSKKKDRSLTIILFLRKMQEILFSTNDLKSKTKMIFQYIIERLVMLFESYINTDIVLNMLGLNNNG